MKTLATHVLLELEGLDGRRLSDVDDLEGVLRAAAERAGCEVLGVARKRFEPHGASVVLLVSESHLSIHTWPEHDYAAVDLFTCGPALPEAGVAEILRQLRPARHSVQTLRRGVGAPG